MVIMYPIVLKRPSQITNLTIKWLLFTNSFAMPEIKKKAIRNVKVDETMNSFISEGLDVTDDRISNIFFKLFASKYKIKFCPRKNE